jgi:hypothetical protein
MPLLPIRPVAFGPGDLLRIELLGFLDVAVRANNLPVRSEEEEHSGYVRAAHSQLHERRTLERCREWWAMVVAILQFAQPGDHQLVQWVVPASE